MSWTSVRAKIKTKLDGLVTAGTLGSVLNGEQNPQKVEISAYPAAEIVRMNTDPEYLTNREDIQNYTFAINLYKPLTDDDYATVEIAMDSVVDAVLTAFLNDASLTGTVDARLMPIPNNASAITWNGILHRRDIILLRCRVIKAMA